MPDNLKGVCRLCLSKEGFMFPIFRSDRKSETPFRTKILSCASIEVFADDDLPSEVCHICAHQVEKSFHFRTICESSDATLRSQMGRKENDITQGHISDQSLVLDGAEFQSDWSEKKTCLNPGGKCDDAIDFVENKVCESVENVMGIFICFACSIGFTAYDILIDHIAKNHPDVTLFPCKSCNLYFSDIGEYRGHLNVRHALSCNKCDLVFKHQKNLELHIKSHSLEVFTCRFCKKLFDKQFKLKQHELTHLDRMCKFCCKILETADEYSAHIKICNKSYFCKFCNQTFTFKKDLIEHVNDCHENSTIHKCKDCNKVFGKWADVQQHSCEGAAADKNLHCKYCQVTFAESSELDSHISSEHNEELLICRFCTKSFTLKSALRRHEKSHSGLKPYQCKYCPKKFKDNSTCIVHIRTHTGEHPFQCQECHKDFKQLANLKMHTYRHHKINSKAAEEKTDVLGEEQIFDRYSASIMDSYSPDGAKTFQQLDSDISNTFSEGAGILLTDHH